MSETLDNLYPNFVTKYASISPIDIRHSQASISELTEVGKGHLKQARTIELEELTKLEETSILMTNISQKELRVESNIELNSLPMDQM